MRPIHFPSAFQSVHVRRTSTQTQATELLSLTSAVAMLSASLPMDEYPSGLEIAAALVLKGEIKTLWFVYRLEPEVH